MTKPRGKRVARRDRIALIQARRALKFEIERLEHYLQRSDALIKLDYWDLEQLNFTRRILKAVEK